MIKLSLFHRLNQITPEHSIPRRRCVSWILKQFEWGLFGTHPYHTNREGTELGR